MVSAAMFARRLRHIVRRSLRQPLLEYEQEVARINAALGYGGKPLEFKSDVRAKFFTGSPVNIQAGRYVLFCTLNHRWAPPAKRSVNVLAECNRLNDPTLHFDSCANYFAPAASPDGFFKKLQCVVDGFCSSRSIQVPQEPYGALNHHAFFVDWLPYFSAESEQIPQMIREFCALLNGAVHRAFWHHRPPGGIVLRGKNTFDLLESDFPSLIWQPRQLVNRFSSGRVFNVEVTTLPNRVRAVRYPMVRYALSHNQLREIGSLIA